MAETLLDFKQETMKALWHAYHMLDMSSSGSVHVSQLKVITSTIGSKLGFHKAEEILNIEGVVSMDFQTFYEIVKKELLDKQEETSPDESVLGTRLNSIIKTCWTFCNFERQHHCKSFTTEHCVVLWRLYNFLSETDDKGEPAVPVLLHPEEAALLLRGFIDVTGQKNKENQIKVFLAEKQDSLLTFTDFLNVFEKDYVTGLSNKNITIGLNHLYDTYILNVLMKGKIRKRGFKVKTWKDRFLVLTPTHLKYFVTSDEKVLKGTIEFDSECTLEIPAERPTHKPNRFIIHTPKKPYEMSAFDLKSKNEWVSAIELALSRVGKDPNVQREATLERCMARAEKRRLAAEEERKRKEEAELLRSRESELDEQKRKRLEDGEVLKARLGELEEERRRREEAEARWQAEQTLREAEQQRLRELEEIKRELERLLAEERQAKKDEEIVRSLQSKLLEEEFEKREELERLKQQQEEMLRAEREQKAVLESDRREQERLLAEAQARLEQLERDKTAAAEKMKEAAEKLQRAEKDRHIMEEKVKLWKTPVGLARPIQPHVDPLVTHRGRGAFCKQDFVKKPPGIDADAKDDNVPDVEKKPDVGKIPDETDTSVRSNEDTEDDENFDQVEEALETDSDEKSTTTESTIIRDNEVENGETILKTDETEAEDASSMGGEVFEASNMNEANADEEKERTDAKSGECGGNDVRNNDVDITEETGLSEADERDSLNEVNEETSEKEDDETRNVEALNADERTEGLKQDTADRKTSESVEEQQDELERSRENDVYENVEVSLESEGSIRIHISDCKTINENDKEAEETGDELHGKVDTDTVVNE